MPGTVVVSGLTSDDFSWTNFATSGGNYLVAVNGTDPVQLYDGANWTEPSITGTGAEHFSYVFSSKSRLFFLKKDTSEVYYLAADSIAGPASLLTVGGELTLGGTLVAGAGITTDAGTGMDDFTGFVSSEGEVVVYSGTDPSDPDAWSKRGTFRIGRPIGGRCLLQVGGDVVVLTQDGVVSLMRSILLDRSAQSKAAFTDHIRTAFARQYGLSGSMDGWQVVTWPKGHLAFVNVPITADTTFHQYVMNVLTGSWCRFTELNATCWALAGDDLYFGTPDGYVYLYGDAGNDNGTPINAIGVGAFSSFKSQGVIKHTKAAQAFAQASGSYTLGVNMAVDFTLRESAAGTTSFSRANFGSLWDTATWDTSEWTSIPTTLANTAWLGVSEAGYFIAPVVVAQVDNTEFLDVEFINMNILYETGAIVG